MAFIDFFTTQNTSALILAMTGIWFLAISLRKPWKNDCTPYNKGIKGYKESEGSLKDEMESRSED